MELRVAHMHLRRARRNQFLRALLLDQHLTRRTIFGMGCPPHKRLTAVRALTLPLSMQPMRPRAPLVHWLLVAGCWLLVVGILDFGFWILPFFLCPLTFVLGPSS